MPDIIDTSLPNATVGVYYEQKVIAIDYDGQSSQLRFAVVEKPNWLQYEQLTTPEGLLTGELKLYGTPTIDDLYLSKIVRIQVTDAAGGTTEEIFTLNINESAASGPIVGANESGDSPPAEPTPTAPAEPTPTATATVAN